MGTNIDLVGNFIETCGPFLVNSRDENVARRINNLLDYMWRLKEKETISSMQTNNLESAYYMCRPEKNPQISYTAKNGGSALSIVQQYIQHLFLERIPKAASYHSNTLPQPSKDEPDSDEVNFDLDSVVSYILAVPWAENEDFIFRQVLLLISTARYNDMECIAILLAAIKER